MEPHTWPDEDAAGEDAAGEDADAPRVTVHQSRPGRVVFTESGNCDAWIATDLMVEPER